MGGIALVILLVMSAVFTFFILIFAEAVGIILNPYITFVIVFLLLVVLMMR